jgi:hypothetical protein
MADNVLALLLLMVYSRPNWPGCVAGVRWTSVSVTIESRRNVVVVAHVYGDLRMIRSLAASK